MFDVGWSEMLVIAVVMIVVVGPKDLPKMLRTFGKMTAKVRGMAGDFQKQFNEALKEAELDDVKKSVDSLRSMNPASEIKKQLNPFEKAAADVRAGLQSAMAPKPSTSSAAASPAAHQAEPLKTGAAPMPGAEETKVNGAASLGAPPPDLAQPVAPSPAAASATPVAGAAAAPATPTAPIAAAEVPAPPAAPAKPARARRAAAGATETTKTARAPAKRAAAAPKSTGSRKKSSEETK
ncbi:MAG: Sec-independent protein translocase protein TatB [Rhizobiaceae bacterium]|nr:Sec-independent protein translocase protein TatB [Rhizobiaceae bacterium]